MRLSKAEFAKKTGIRTNHIATYVKRGAIVLNKKGEVDLQQEVNKKFYLDRLERQHVGVQTKSNDDTSNGEKSNELLGIRELERIKKSLDIQKTTEEVELLKIKKEKAQGLVIPLDLTKDLFSRNVKNMVVEFDSAADRILTMIASKHKLSNENVANYRGQIKKKINEAVDDTIKQTKKEISLIINEFAEKRAIGEKE